MRSTLFGTTHVQKILSIFRTVMLCVAVSVPLLGLVSFAYAQGTSPTQPGFQLVPCDGVTVKCDYNQFIIGIQRIIKACILFAVPLAAGVFGWFGFKMMVAGPDVKSREEAKEAMFKVLKGMLLMLGAWYVVDLALGGLLDPAFKSGLEQ